MRYPNMTWIMAGVFLGAAVAAVASTSAGIRHLLLLQPALDPESYVQKVIRKARKRPLGAGDTEGTAFGYPVPPGLLDPRAASEVDACLRGFDGAGIVIRYSEPAPADASRPGFDVVSVPGEWRIGRRGSSELVAPALEWLDRVTR